MSEDEIKVAVFMGKLERLMSMSGEMKSSLSVDNPSQARRWAVVYTDLEKVSAYVQTYLKESES